MALAGELFRKGDAYLAVAHNNDLHISVPFPSGRADKRGVKVFPKVLRFYECACRMSIIAQKKRIARKGALRALFPL